MHVLPSDRFILPIFQEKRTVSQLELCGETCLTSLTNKYLPINTKAIKSIKQSYTVETKTPDWRDSSSVRKTHCSKKDLVHCLEPHSGSQQSRSTGNKYTQGTHTHSGKTLTQKINKSVYKRNKNG